MRHAPRTPRTPPAPVVRKAPSAPPEQTYTPPAGFPADPVSLLAYLRAGTFTEAQLRYLHSNAFNLYVAALANARGNPALSAVVVLGDQIVSVWANVRMTTTPPTTGNPFIGG
jgi:hypothetical protein